MSDDDYEHDFENDNQNEDANKGEEEQDQEKQDEEEDNQNEQEEQNNEQSQHNDNQEEDQNQDQQNQEQQDEDQQQQEDKEDNQESDAQEQEKEEIDNISEVQSKDESKLNDQSRINLESIDAVSVKVQDTNKKQSKKPTSAKPSSQQQMVGQLLKNHKEKQEKLKKKEDEIYIAEQVEKKKPKIIAPKPVTKQKLVFDKETKKKLEDPNIDNQKKAAILTKDLAKKLDKSVKIDEKTKKIEIKKPTERSEAKVKKNQFELRIGEGIKGKLEEDSEKADTKQLKNERQMFIEMKKATKKKMIEQLKEQDQMLKVKQAKQNEDQLKMKDKDTKVLKDNSEKLLEMKQMYQAQKQEIEQAKQEDEKQASKYEKDKLVALQRENESLKSELFKLERNIQECDQEIRQKQQHESVIPLGNDKYTSLKKLKLQGSSQQNTTMASISQASNASYSPENLSELGQVQISVKVLREIIKNGLEIADAYQLLDDDKDGVLTIQEVKNNLGRLNLNLEEQEIQKFIAELDDDSNGVLTQQEFIAYLTKNIQVQRKFEEIMGDIQDVQNPIILDERRLHIQFLKKYVIKQLEEEQNIEYTLKPQCNKILQKLKRYEKTYDKLKATDTNLYSLRKQLEKLRKELREQQERRDKAIQELDEKKEMILKNIDDLETELTDLSGKKYSLKLEAQDFTKLHQRLNLKLQAYKQIKRNYEKAIKENNNDELQRELQARRALDAQLQTEKQANELQRIKNQKEYQELQKLQPQQEIQKSQVQESFQEEKQEDQYEEQQQQLQQPKVTKNNQRPQIGSLKFTSQMDDQFQNDIPSKGTPELPTLLPKQNGVPQQFSFQGEQQQETVKKQQLQIEVPKKQTKSKFQQEKQEQLVPHKQEQELSKSRTQLSQTFADLDKLQKCLPSLIKVKKYIKQILHQEEPHDLIGDLGKLPLNDARCQFCLHELMTRICKSCMPKNFYCPECYEERHTNHKLRNHEFFFTKNDKKFNIK